MFRFICIFIGCSNYLFAQTAEEVLTHVNDAYSKVGAYSCNVHYEYFSTAQDLQPSDSLDAMVDVKGDSFCIQYNNIDFLSDGISIIQIDSMNQIIIFQDGAQLQRDQQFFVSKKWLKNVGHKMQKVAIGNNTITFRYYPDEKKQTQVDYIDFIINTNTWLLDEMYLQYNNVAVIKDNTYVLTNPKIAIQFKNFMPFYDDFEDLYGLDNWILKNTITNQVTLKNKQFELIY